MLRLNARTWLLALMSLSWASMAQASETQTMDTDWCTITVPKEVAVGQALTATIVLKDIAEGLSLGGDLHWNKPEGAYGGFNRWGGEPQAVESGQTITRRLTPTAKDGMATVHILLFLSPTGQFGDAVHQTASPHMAIAGASQTLPDRPDTVTYKKSWISVGRGVSPGKQPGEPLMEGDPWEVTIEYFVDPEDDWGGTRLRHMGLGPWVDNPDGTYTDRRTHHNYPGIGGVIDCVIGEKASHTFRFQLPACHTSETGRVGDGLTLFVRFEGADNKPWPWHVRGGGTNWGRRGGFFELDAETDGNLFTYDEPVVMQAVLRNVAQAGAQKTLDYTVTNTAGTEIASGSVAFTVEENGQKVAIPLEIAERGTFLLSATVDDWETREITFARIPDVMAITRGERTRFGTQSAIGPYGGERLRETLQIMRQIGLTIHRTWMSWHSVQPWPGEWRHIEGWQQSMDIAKEVGVDHWICFLSPPMWVLDGVRARGFSYAAFPFRDEDLRTVVDHLTRAFKGKFIGWEWLNEIVPGTISPNPVSDYVRFAKVATEASKAVDPDLINSAAGGLFPRSFRHALLSEGLAEHIDVLPIHYGNGGTIEEARSDLARVGAAGQVAVWDNETGRGLSTWKMPLVEAIQSTRQSNWILTNWTDQVMVDTEKIVYFTGAGSQAGNWSYLWDDLSPRPLVATLAVFTSKMHGVTPLGAFMLGESGVFHLFASEAGTPLLVAGSHVSGGEQVALQVGAGPVVVTDHQGNETPLATENGTAPLELASLRYFIEGGDLDVLKAFVVPTILAASAAEKRGALLQRPRMTMLTGREEQLFVQMRNLYDRPITGALNLVAPEDWPAVAATRFDLAAGATQVLSLTLALPDGIEPDEYQLAVRIDHDWDKLPTLDKPFSLTVISPDMLGNLLVNAGFEEAGSDASDAAHWSQEDSAARAPYEGDDPGHGDWMLAIRKASNWSHVSQTTDRVRPGQTYLYSMWVHSHDIGGGSNIAMRRADGSTRNLYTSGTFMFVPGQPWHLYSSTVRMPDDVVSAAFIPVAKGSGYAHFDNIRLTTYEGTSFAAEAHQPRGAITIDGRLDDWDERCPIPLFSSSQVIRLQDSYQWKPENLSGVAYARWTDKGLYLAVTLRDDRHVANTTGELTSQSDSVVVGIHPANRRPDTEAQAYTLAINAAKPGGGSGVHTIYRPAERSGGLPSGQRAQDSSVYEMAIRHEDGHTVYEIFMPYIELGFTGGLGTKIGLSLQVNDNDGQGRAAMMLWGEGLHPDWDPNRFGVLTLVE